MDSCFVLLMKFRYWFGVIYLIIVGTMGGNVLITALTFGIAYGIIDIITERRK